MCDVAAHIQLLNRDHPFKMSACLGGGGVSHVPMVKRSQCIRIKNLLHKHFAGMPMVEGQGSKIVKICRRLKWMVPYLNRGCLLYLCFNLLKLLLNFLNCWVKFKVQKSYLDQFIKENENSVAKIVAEYQTIDGSRQGYQIF